MCAKEIDIPTLRHGNDTAICKTYIFEDTIHYLINKNVLGGELWEIIIAGGETFCRSETKTYYLFPK